MSYITHKYSEKKNSIIKKQLKNFPIKESNFRNVGTLPGFALILLYHEHRFINLVIQTKYFEKTLNNITLTFDITLEDYIIVNGVKISKLIPLLFIKENGYQEISNNRIALMKMLESNEIEICVKQKNKKVFKPTKTSYDNFLKFANTKYNSNDIYKNKNFSISDNNDLVYKNTKILLNNLRKCKYIFTNDDDSEGEDEDDNSDKDDIDNDSDNDSDDDRSYNDESDDNDSFIDDSDSDDEVIIIDSDSEDEDEPKRKRLRHKY